MALAGDVGVELFAYEGRLPAHAIWFGEDQGRYLIEVAPHHANDITARARLLALPARIIGRTGGEGLVLKGEELLSLADLREAHEGWMPGYMGSA
jgi:phosphoribosylformylglycinamidine synthase